MRSGNETRGDMLMHPLLLPPPLVLITASTFVVSNRMSRTVGSSQGTAVKCSASYHIAPRGLCWGEKVALNND